MKKLFVTDIDERRRRIDPAAHRVVWMNDSSTVPSDSNALAPPLTLPFLSGHPTFMFPVIRATSNHAGPLSRVRAWS